MLWRQRKNLSTTQKHYRGIGNNQPRITLLLHRTKLHCVCTHRINQYNRNATTSYHCLPPIISAESWPRPSGLWYQSCRASNGVNTVGLRAIAVKGCTWRKVEWIVKTIILMTLSLRFSYFGGRYSSTITHEQISYRLSSWKKCRDLKLSHCSKNHKLLVLVCLPIVIIFDARPLPILPSVSLSSSRQWFGEIKPSGLTKIQHQSNIGNHCLSYIRYQKYEYLLIAYKLYLFEFWSL